MKSHIMVDLETLGTGSFPVILSLGAVRFDPREMMTAPPDLTDEGNTFFERVSPESCLRAGATINDDTIAWWFKPEAQAARDAIIPTGEKPFRPLSSVLGLFHTWCKQVGPIRSALVPPAEHLWSHGLTFDVAILGAGTEKNRQLGGLPVSYKALRDTRTLFSLIPDKVPIYPADDFPGMVPHHPVWDAWRQAYAVQRAYAHLGAIPR